jgi:hypothetical protein
MRELYDALNPADIPGGAQCIAYYVDQLTPAQAAARWPGKLLVSIARRATEDALVGDVESGDLEVGQIVAWVQGQRTRGVANPWVYCSQSPWPNVRAQFVAAGVGEPLWWIAAPGPSLQLLSGTVATQCLYQGDYDVSALADNVPGLDQEGTMFVIQQSDPPEGQPAACYLLREGACDYIGAEADLTAYVARFGPPQPTTTAQIATFLAHNPSPAPPAVTATTEAVPLTVILTGTATPETAAAAPPVA